MKSLAWLRTGPILALLAAGALDAVLSATYLRAAAVLLSAAGVAVFAAALFLPEHRLVLPGLVLAAGATAAGLAGPVRTSHLVAAAASGLLVLAALELSRWEAATRPGPGQRPALEIERGALWPGLLTAALSGIAGAVLGIVVIAERGTFAGFGLGALVLGVTACLGLVVLLGVAAGEADRPA
jgi:hypothetical protein